MVDNINESPPEPSCGNKKPGFFNPRKWLGRLNRKFVRETPTNPDPQDPTASQLTVQASGAQKYFNIKSLSLMAVEHCNNVCKYCSTSATFAPKKCHPASAFIPWLKFMDMEGVPFDGICITGGEPFLHDDLFSFLEEIRMNLPHKTLGVFTNFIWGSEAKLKPNSAMLGSLKTPLDYLTVSKYPNIVERLGGEDRFNAAVETLKTCLPRTYVSVFDQSNFLAWELHADVRPVTGNCVTSDCYILRADGKLSHCSVGVGAKNRPEYRAIVAKSKERLFNLSEGLHGFSAWAEKYPIDLCYHCSLWRHNIQPWAKEDHRSKGEAR